MTTFEGTQALIIEDDLMSVNVLRSLLDQLAVHTDVINDIYHIGQHLENSATPHVIFLDLEMPGTNGYEVLDMIYGNPQFEGVPVVAYTTHISHMNEAKRAGFHSFLGKPLDSAMFADQLGRILSGEMVWEAA